MTDADELLREAEHCRQQASVADALTRRILLELADQFEAAARLALAYPRPADQTSSQERAAPAPRDRQ
jgi:hypothetical protein